MRVFVRKIFSEPVLINFFPMMTISRNATQCYHGWRAFWVRSGGKIATSVSQRIGLCHTCCGKGTDLNNSNLS